MNDWYFVVWDLDVRTLLGTPDTEAEAVAMTAAIIENLGDDYANNLSIGWENAEGEGEELATGTELLRRIRQQKVVVT